MNFTIYLYAIFAGFMLSNILTVLGVLNGMDGVRYYGEVHLSFWNSVIHTLFMPFTYMGFNISVPSILLKNPEKYASVMQWCFYLIYMTHYLTINIPIGLITSMVYYFSVEFASKFYTDMKFTRLQRIVIGLSMSTVALLIQESLGHYIGGDDPSRLEGVLNAILYAKFYSIGHFFNLKGQ